MSATARGRVSIVGAGPGDPELITVRALARIRTAEVLVYDRLVDPALVAEAPPAAERVFAGKARGFAALGQHEIEALLIARALAGKHVVRLKGGDPYVFGRGGEEVESLVAAGIPVEVVPGVSSALAAPASAGIPVTHRELSSSLTIVTGHEDPKKSEAAVDWNWLAASNGTLVILMGLSQLPGIRDRLIAGGRSRETPAAAIASGTRREQRVVSAALADLPEVVAAAQLVAPALVVVGDVVRYRELLAPSALNGVPVTATPGQDSRVEPGPAVFAPVGSRSSHLSREQPELSDVSRSRRDGRRRRRPYGGRVGGRRQASLVRLVAGITGDGNG
ncbi:MAG: uroporphyrin-III C-methyltransferase [Thermomicrobiales bacterium]|jgi:uroporphyrin-III C-methyltransferase|nr:uroporphyrin-III C-methyltransferase [Thermomicrobiales bacterium]MDF2757975.1 uroporphyrin-III C-methyltransferase [Thermomicrobiales bacterium]